MTNRANITKNSDEFQNLWEAHNELSWLPVSEVGDFLGGKVGQNIYEGFFENACAIRLSYSFNQAGPGIEYLENRVSSDAQGNWHIFRVTDMLDFVESHYGSPDIVSSDPADFEGQQGIILFEVDSWDNATGHIDLYDRFYCATECYFDESSKVQMWVFDKPQGIEMVQGDLISHGPTVQILAEDLPYLKFNEYGIPTYEIDGDGNFSLRNTFDLSATMFSEEELSMTPVLDQDGHPIAFYISDDPDMERGFYIKLQDAGAYLLEQYLTGIVLSQAENHNPQFQHQGPSAAPSLVH